MINLHFLFKQSKNHSGFTNYPNPISLDDDPFGKEPQKHLYHLSFNIFCCQNRKIKENNGNSGLEKIGGSY